MGGGGIKIFLRFREWVLKKKISVAKSFCRLPDLDDMATNLQHCLMGTNSFLFAHA